MTRVRSRRVDALRPTSIETDFLKYPPGSALIRGGDTRVLCTAFVVEGVPEFLVGSGKGWLTAEYAMLPASTPQRKPRESATGRPDGRSQEIRRIVGRALRAAVDLEKLGERTIWIDCDVLQADGGTRTLSITGSWVALALACHRLALQKVIPVNPVRLQLAAVSVGVVNGRCVLDLDYEEDSAAEVDMNVVMSADGRFVEIQGTSEAMPFDTRQLNRLLALAHKGCRELMRIQRRALKERGIL